MQSEQSHNWRIIRSSVENTKWRSLGASGRQPTEQHHLSCIAESSCKFLVCGYRFKSFKQCLWQVSLKLLVSCHIQLNFSGGFGVIWWVLHFLHYLTLGNCLARNCRVHHFLTLGNCFNIDSLIKLFKTNAPTKPRVNRFTFTLHPNCSIEKTFRHITWLIVILFTCY